MHELGEKRMEDTGNTFVKYLTAILLALFEQPNDVGFMIGLVLVTIGAAIERTSLGWIVPGVVICVVTAIPYFLRKGK
jgi:hypothetical protein